MKITKFQLVDRTKGRCGTMWVKEKNPYYSYYKQNLETLEEIQRG